MEFTGFTNDDFEVFEVPGLEERMTALKANLRPKLVQLGTDIAAYLEEMLGVPIFPHVAKHARRTVNPPNDSWVAFCSDKRGYKKHPHFQIGAWSTHAFATFGLIYESPMRSHYADALRSHATEVVERIPQDYVWIPNHMDPEAISAGGVRELKLIELANQLEKGRQGELLVGIKIPKNTAVQMSAAEFEDSVKRCFGTLQPLYQLAMSKEASHV